MGDCNNCTEKCPQAKLRREIALDRMYTKQELVKLIKKIEVGELVEVKHGEWTGEADGYADGKLVYDVWYCSECNYCIDNGTDDPELLPNYCPNCGAKMDGRGKES